MPALPAEGSEENPIRTEAGDTYLMSLAGSSGALLRRWYKRTSPASSPSPTRVPTTAPATTAGPGPGEALVSEGDPQPIPTPSNPTTPLRPLTVVLFFHVKKRNDCQQEMVSQPVTKYLGKHSTRTSRQASSPLVTPPPPVSNLLLNHTYPSLTCAHFQGHIAPGTAHLVVGPADIDSGHGTGKVFEA